MFNEIAIKTEWSLPCKKKKKKSYRTFPRGSEAVYKTLHILLWQSK